MLCGIFGSKVKWQSKVYRPAEDFQEMYSRKPNSYAFSCKYLAQWNQMMCIACYTHFFIHIQPICFKRHNLEKNTLRLLWFRCRVVYTKIAGGSIPLTTVASPKCPWTQSWNGWNSFILNTKVCSSQMFQHAQPHQELRLCSWQAFQKDLDRRSLSSLIERTGFEGWLLNSILSQSGNIVVGKKNVLLFLTYFRSFVYMQMCVHVSICDITWF